MSYNPTTNKETEAQSGTLSSLLKGWEPLGAKEVADWIPDFLTWCDLQCSELPLAKLSWLDCTFSSSPPGRTFCLFQVKPQFSAPLNSSMATVSRVGPFSPSGPRTSSSSPYANHATCICLSLKSLLGEIQGTGATGMLFLFDPQLLHRAW